MTHRVLLLFIPTLLFSFCSSAQSIYKTIDENGKVSYSSTPSATNQGSVKVEIPRPPSDNDIKAAKERHQQNLRAEKTYRDSRQEREQKIAEETRIRQENKERYIPPPPTYEKSKDEGPYYGIPGRGILVLPKGPRINR